MAQKKPNESADCAPFRFVSVAKVGKVFGMCKKKAEKFIFPLLEVICCYLNRALICYFHFISTIEWFD